MLPHSLDLPSSKSDPSPPCLLPSVKEPGSKLSERLKEAISQMVVKEVAILGMMAVVLPKETSAQVTSPPHCPLFIALAWLRKPRVMDLTLPPAQVYQRPDYWGLTLEFHLPCTSMSK